jgi:tRNA-dihydrouridine synthase 3
MSATAESETNGGPPPEEIKKEEKKADTMIATAEAEINTCSGPSPENGPSKTIEEIKKEEKKTDQNDVYSIKLKPEFILSERSPIFAPLPETQDDGRSEDPERKKKNKKQNKKRPRDVRQDDSEKVCLSIIRGEDAKCPYGDKCKFSHDMKAFMATRQPDIEIEGGCPNYNLSGFCIYGAMCRCGGAHINMSTGENFRKAQPEDKPAQPLPSEESCNTLPKEVQIQLRKRTYAFKCQRHFEQNGKKSGGNKNSTDNDKMENGEAAAKDFTSMTPVELKTRKIIDFSNKVYVAPLTTVGNLPFRRVMKKLGADITCGEMAMTSCLLQGSASEWALLKRHKDEDVFGVQIASAHPDQFTRACELIEAHTTVDFVDLNLGCPLDLVCNKGAGAALMNRDGKLRSSLLGISQTLSCPITIKMRTGWDMNKPFAHRLVPKIQSWGQDGIAAIMVCLLVLTHNVCICHSRHILTC